MKQIKINQVNDNHLVHKREIPEHTICCWYAKSYLEHIMTRKLHHPTELSENEIGFYLTTSKGEQYSTKASSSKPPLGREPK